jgi:ribonuclease HI
MEHVSIYLEDNFKGIKTQKAAVIFLIEMVVKGAPATLVDLQVLTMTPNQAALASLIMALSRLNKPCSLDIYLENQYVAAGIEKWISSWSTNDWKNSKNMTVENVVEWQLLTYMLSRHEYKLHLKENHSYKNWMMESLTNVDFPKCEGTFEKE